jgi:hypothetical protein
LLVAHRQGVLQRPDLAFERAHLAVMGRLHGLDLPLERIDAGINRLSEGVAGKNRPVRQRRPGDQRWGANLREARSGMTQNRQRPGYRCPHCYILSAISPFGASNSIVSPGVV